jgi:hypothetical protein
MKIQIEISKGKNIKIKYRVDITNNIRGDRTENRKVQKTFFFSSGATAQRGQGPLICKVSRSHTMTHRSR